MKTTNRTFTAILLGLFLATLQSLGVDFSSNVSLERFTPLDGNTFQFDTGYLLSNGKFRVITSSTENCSLYGLTPDLIAPFAGKPLMNEELFNNYHVMRLIPRWVRSKADYTIGYANYVAVAVSGRGDPNPAVAILKQPQSARVLLGSSASFNVDAQPSGYLSYQWYKGRTIPGATSPVYTIHTVTKADAGVYKAALTTGSKPVMSKNALLQVVLPVTIRTPPRSQTLKAGRSVAFRVAVAGTAPFTYQWYYNEAPIANATKSFYTISKVQAAHAGKYGVVVSNGPSQAASDEATLTVQ
jgi:Immunoglobulin I-set domain